MTYRYNLAAVLLAVVVLCCATVDSGVWIAFLSKPKCCASPRN